MKKKPITITKGALFLLFSKAYFMVTGYIIYVVLTRSLGPGLFGVYSIVIGVASTVSLVLIGGINQTTSKFISEQVSLASGIKNASFRLQLIIGGLAFLAFLACAKLFSRLFNDRDLARYFLIISPMILFYSLYGVFVGYANGLKQFKKQCVLEILYSTVKALLIIAFVFMGFSLTGVVWGFVFSTFLALAIAIFIFGIGPAADKFPVSKIFKFEIWIIAYTAIINLLLNTDLFLLKALSDRSLANVYAGFYNAALTIARIPYLVIVPISYVVFPFISEFTHVKDNVKTKKYIRGSFRYCGIFLALSAVLISANAKGIITLLYSQAYAPGAAALSIVIFGVVFLAMILVSTTIISGGGLPGDSIKITGIILIIDFVLNYLLVPRFNITGAALATTIAMGIGLLISGSYLLKRFNAFLPALSLFRILLACVAVFFLSGLFRVSGILLTVKLAALASVYLGILVLLKELTVVFRPPFFIIRNE
ncbi:MAG: oligosaccharide flippase family protein [Candidatus Omnitrophica bacterium]|nr:oligosaccharide flippase family protein [Candidatus Omnitrophota bacterium]MDD5552855.1 oligosaccharide flippase family protein [Candidatus Omnitrophota bacterium]